MAEESIERADQLIANGQARLTELQAAIRESRGAGDSTLQAITISGDLRAALAELRALREGMRANDPRQ